MCSVYVLCMFSVCSLCVCSRATKALLLSCCFPRDHATQPYFVPIALLRNTPRNTLLRNIRNNHGVVTVFTGNILQEVLFVFKHCLIKFQKLPYVILPNIATAQHRWSPRLLNWSTIKLTVCQ